MIYFVRHGESEANQRERKWGQSRLFAYSHTGVWGGIRAGFGFFLKKSAATSIGMDYN